MFYEIPEFPGRKQKRERMAENEQVRIVAWKKDWTWKFNIIRPESTSKDLSLKRRTATWKKNESFSLKKLSSFRSKKNLILGEKKTELFYGFFFVCFFFFR